MPGGPLLQRIQFLAFVVVTVRKDENHRLMARWCEVSFCAMWEFPKIGVPYFGVLIITRILLFRVLY